MTRLERAAKNIASLQDGEVFRDVFSKSEIKDKITELNTEKQLFEKGIDREGKRLISPKAEPGEVYAPLTIVLKQRFGKPTDRVTWKDKGDFYESIDIQVNEREININADESKLLDWSKNIVGLTDGSKEVLKEKTVPAYQEHFKALI